MRRKFKELLEGEVVKQCKQDAEEMKLRPRINQQNVKNEQHLGEQWMGREKGKRPDKLKAGLAYT